MRKLKLRESQNLRASTLWAWNWKTGLVSMSESFSFLLSSLYRALPLGKYMTIGKWFPTLCFSFLLSETEIKIIPASWSCAEDQMASVQNEPLTCSGCSSMFCTNVLLILPCQHHLNIAFYITFSYYLLYLWIFFFSVLGIESRVSYLLDERSPTELHPQPSGIILAPKITLCTWLVLRRCLMNE